MNLGMAFDVAMVMICVLLAGQTGSLGILLVMMLVTEDGARRMQGKPDWLGGNDSGNPA